VSLGTGRPIALTPTLRELLDLFVRGSSVKRACAVVGVDEVTFYRWLHRGKQFATTLNGRAVEASRSRSTRSARPGERRAGESESRATDAWLHMVNAEEFASRKLEERNVAEQVRAVVKTVTATVVEVVDAVIPHPDLRQRFPLAIAASFDKDEHPNEFEPPSEAIAAANGVARPTATC
jgi:hypothetical protein